MNYFFIFFVFIILMFFAILFSVFLAEKIKKGNINKYGSSMIKISYLNAKNTEKKIKNIISASNFPLALDLVVEHIGKTPDVYIVTFKKYFPKLINLVKKELTDNFEIKTDDYLVFHQGGFYEVFSGELKKEDLLKIDFQAIDMSKVNEIGEGAAIRMVFIPERGAIINMFFSAPSRFQLKEIINSAAEPFKGKGIYVSKDKNAAILDFNSPDFLYKLIK